MGSIGLDNLFDEQPVETGSGPTDLVSTTKAPVLEAAETSMAKVMDRYKTLMYMIDTSGSMGQPLVEDVSYEWPEDLRAYLRRYLEFSSEEETEELTKMMDASTDDQLREKLISLNPINYGIQIRSVGPNTKMNLVKIAVGNYIDRRHEEIPDARLVLGRFEYTTEIMAATYETIKAAIDRLQPGGGTRIMSALEDSLAYFKKYPNSVGINHLVIVTDGEDSAAIEAEKLIDELAANGVVVDYIFVNSKASFGYIGERQTASQVANVFMKLCKATGGAYAECSSASDFEKKFLAASTRLCLPPGVE